MAGGALHYFDWRHKQRSRSAVAEGSSSRARRLVFEPLEQRQMLATITVTSLADNLDVDGQVTLREAIRAAEMDISVDGSAAGSGADTIQFAAGLSGAVSLVSVGDTASGSSAFAITTDVTIRGNANGIAIERSAIGPEMRLFRVAAGGSLRLESITLSGGMLRGATGDVPNGAGGEGRGGAIYSQGSVTVTASTLVGNEVRGGDGAGSGARGSGRGGAIYNDGGTLSIVNATLSGNSAFSGSGTGNVSSFGGGIYSRNGSLWIHNSTITAGTATTGRGVYVAAVNGTACAAVHSSIIGQADTLPVSRDFLAVIDTGGTLMVTGADNLIRTQNDFDSIAVSTADPLLGSLTNNGGPTRTHGLLAGSPAINQGANPMNLVTDQRGTPHAREVGGRADIGAFEVQTTSGPALVGDYNHNNTVDASDYVLWRRTLGSQVAAFAGADGNGNGMIDAGDYAVWRANFGRTLAAAATPKAEDKSSTATADIASAIPHEAAPGAKQKPLGDMPLASRRLPDDLVLALLDRSAAMDGEPWASAPMTRGSSETPAEDADELAAFWAEWSAPLRTL